MQRSCARCGKKHPVLTEVHPEKRTLEAAAFYIYASWFLRKNRDMLWHKTTDAVTDLFLYGSASICLTDK